MKKSRFLLVPFLLLLFPIVHSCNSNKANENFLSPTLNSENANRIISEKDSINYDSLGVFAYNHVKKHLLYYDPYELIPKEQRESLKHVIDSVKSIPNKNSTYHWDEVLKRKQISKNGYFAIVQAEEAIKKKYN